jgi:hypothetical protein
VNLFISIALFVVFHTHWQHKPYSQFGERINQVDVGFVLDGRHSVVAVNTGSGFEQPWPYLYFDLGSTAARWALPALAGYFFYPVAYFMWLLVAHCYFCLLRN